MGIIHVALDVTTTPLFTPSGNCLSVSNGLTSISRSSPLTKIHFHRFAKRLIEAAKSLSGFGGSCNVQRSYYCPYALWTIWSIKKKYLQNVTKFRVEPTIAYNVRAWSSCENRITTAWLRPCLWRRTTVQFITKWWKYMNKCRNCLQTSCNTSSRTSEFKVNSTTNEVCWQLLKK